MGISVIATRDIQPLELILYEWSLIVGPRQLRYENEIICYMNYRYVCSTFGLKILFHVLY